MEHNYVVDTKITFLGPSITIYRSKQQTA